MGRMHLFEFEDLEWFPKSLRNYGTDYLQFVTNKFDFYKDVTPLIVKGVKKSGTNRIIDLASGGGGGWTSLSPYLKEVIPDLKITLTDYYPNIPAFDKTKKSDPELFDYVETSVNAMNVPEEFKGLRTQFLSFHHFRSDDARKILQNAVDAQSPIAIFEGQERKLKFFIMNFFSPVFVLLTTPAIRPFKFGRIIFTYLIPIVPLFIWWDGLVSVLRTYNIKEINEMVSSLNNSESFEWEIGRKSSRGITVPYLLGYPKNGS